MGKNYDGDLFSHLKNNALEGKCIANMVDELWFWSNLTTDNKSTDIFVGDECFGWSGDFLETKDEILSSVSINNFRSIVYLKKFVRKETYYELSNSLKDLNESIFSRTNSLKDPHDKKDYLYLDQRINHVLMPWREVIGRYIDGIVHNPFLDSSILNFMMNIPPKFRKNKHLFKKTISKMFPELFILPMAKSGAGADWRNEVIKNRNLLVKYVKETSSPLDNYISKNEVIELIKHVGSDKSKRLTRYFNRAINFLRRKPNKFGKIVRKVFNEKYSYVGSEKIIIRLLLIRIYLSSIQNKDVNYD